MRRILFSICLMILVVFIIYMAYYINHTDGQKHTALKTEIFYEIPTNGETDLTQIATDWITGYVGQFQQKSVATKQKIKQFNIQNISVINEDKNIVEIKFQMQPAQKNTNFFQSWGGVATGNQVICDWVIVLRQNTSELGEVSAGVITRITMQEYQSNPESLKYSTENKDACQYQVKDHTLYVSYNADLKWEPISWFKVPVDIKTLETYNSGTKIEEGTFQILEEKTVFFAMIDKKPTLVYSNDAGRSWENIVIKNSQLPNITTCMGIYFKDANNGMIVLGTDQVVMGSIETGILKTTDGGKTWSYMGAGPNANVAAGSKFTFVTLDVGFYSSAKGEALQRTEDGGKTWKEVILPQGTLDDPEGIYTWDTVYTHPEMPTLEGDTLTVRIHQNPNQDYKGGKTIAVYQSHDLGKTWSYIDQVEDAT